MTVAILDELKSRIERIRSQGLIPTVRTRVEEVTMRVRERVTGKQSYGGGSGLTPEKGSKSSGNGGLEI